LGFGGWGPHPNPPIPNPQSPIPKILISYNQISQINIIINIESFSLKLKIYYFT
jgi:hypothetical protein